MRHRVHACMVVILAATLLIGCVREVTPAPSPTAVVPPTPKTVAATTSTPAPPKPQTTPKPGTPAPGSAAPYYQGKTLDMAVPSSAGGGTDTVARIVASVLPKHLPGTPRMVVRNQPGGEGAVANNGFWEKSKPDGLSLITNASSQITIAVVRRDIAHYDPAKYEQIMHIARAPSVMLIRKDALSRLTDPKAKPVAIAAREGNETWAVMPLWGQEFLGWNLKWILGFGGTAEQELALRRGEIDMIGTAIPRTIQQLVDEGLVVALVQEGMSIGGKISRRPDFSDVLTFEELLGAKKPFGLPWQAYNAWVAPNFADKWVSTSPGTPANIVNLLLDGARAMSKDPQFDDMVKKLVSPIYSVGFGQETGAIVKGVVETPTEAFEYTTGLQRKFGVIAR